MAVASVPRFPLGLACAAGAITFFAAIGGVIAAVGGGVAPYLIAAKPIVALIIVGLGIVQLPDVRLPAVPRLGMTRMIRGRSAAVTLFAYGFGYGLASTGCTLPLYVSITVIPLTSGFSGSAASAFAAFALAIAILMLATTLLVAAARQRSPRISSAVEGSRELRLNAPDRGAGALRWLALKPPGIPQTLRPLMSLECVGVASGEVPNA